MSKWRIKGPEYRAWNSMLQRCLNPKAAAYWRYGGRGIKVCDEWRSFDAFLRDMGPRPDGTSLDRIDNNGNYEPGNCRWATSDVQRNNRSCTVYVTLNGQQVPLADACKALGLPRHPIYKRIISRGWDSEKALSVSLDGRHRK